MKVLQIDSSILEENSVTKELSAYIVSHINSVKPDADVTAYNLDKDPIPFLSSTSFNDEDQQKLGDKVMDEFMAADILVIGAPMYNFGIPAQLKAWIDRIAVAGKTFKYTENGPVGLVSNKQVIIVSSRGGVYSEELSFLDHQEAHLKSVLGLLGLKDDDIKIIRAEGVNLGPEEAQQAIEKAKAEIDALDI